MIYFDHNATTPLLPEARQAWLDAAERYIGNPSSPHRVGSRADVALQTARQNLADLLDCDAGEIVWTWVPFEENDGRGKDRPVLVVAREAAGTFLAVQLSSKGHAGDRDWVPIGSGPWDRSGRDSWVAVDRVLRLHEQGMRREACALDRMRFNSVRQRLRERYGWQ